MRRAVGTSIAGAALTLIALAFDSATLFVPGIAFVLLGVVAPLRLWLAARGTTVQRTLEHARVLEDEPLRCTVTVRNGVLSLPLPPLHNPLPARPFPLPPPTPTPTSPLNTP